MFNYIRSRIQRGYSLLAMGPNEARILYDLTVTAFSAGGSFFFCRLFVDGERSIWQALIFPLGVVAGNTALGLYSRFRTASGRRKAVCLAISVGLVSFLEWSLLADAAFVLLSALLALPLLITARLLLNLPYTRHKGLVVKAARQRGPVLVIGGAGYIGTHVVEQLLADGQAVRVLDRLMYGRQPLTDFIGRRNFELIEGDATDITRLTYAMQGASAVVHLAGLVGDPACAVDPEYTRHANIIATRMAKDMASALGIYRFVFASSCSVYGCTDHEVDELAELHPVSLYAQTKIDSERELLSSMRDDFFVTVLRFATVFGHSRRPRFDLVANLFVAQAMVDGVITVSGPNQWRPFIHVSDLARAVVAVLKANPPIVQGQIFNVGDRRLNTTILALARRVQALAREIREVQIEVREDVSDRRNYAVCFEKIRSLLGFEARTSLDGGIRELIKAFQNGVYQDYKNELYNNAAMTKYSVDYFRDPIQAGHLYAPLHQLKAA